MKMSCGGCGRFVKGDLYTPDQCRVCWLAYHDPNYRTYFSGELPDRAVEPAKIGGPGTELKKLIASLGLSEMNGCSCNDRARMMDEWGPEGCRARRQEILGWLKENARKAGVGSFLSASWKAVTSGLAFSLDPTDPIGSLLDEAIRRAEVPSRSAGEGPSRL